MIEPGDTAVESANAPEREANTFGAYIRSVRERANASAHALAKRIGVSLAHYVRVELNRKAPVTPDRWGPLLDLGAAPETLHALKAAYWNERAGRTSGRPTPQDRASVPSGYPRSSTWEKLRWEDDDWCWYAVAHHPDGLSQDQISQLTGWSPHRVDQLEKSALAKLRNRAGAREALECLELLHHHRDRMLHVALGAG
jgi:transcriptional regulator with XRE-family HTH domain